LQQGWAAQLGQGLAAAATGCPFDWLDDLG
jgi:hypothetical protein